ncbi:hypothetical protein [Kitasatospora sp. NPDC056531]|uniref:hypothetical protein n=1 Tax=Kitasatospora sp. NPDC056531 TaxID=3345856 RepID=UPI00368F4F94
MDVLVTLTGGAGAGKTAPAGALRHVEPLWRECDLVVDGALAPETLAGLVWSAAAEKAGRSRDS